MVCASERVTYSVYSRTDIGRRRVRQSVLLLTVVLTSFLCTKKGRTGCTDYAVIRSVYFVDVIFLYRCNV